MIVEKTLQQQETIDISDIMQEHLPVMLKEILEYLNPESNQIFVDCTVKMEGHSKAILERMSTGGRLIAIDRDSESLEIAKKNLKEFNNQCHFVNEDFRNIERILKELNVPAVDGILLDLGISSFQMNNAQRDFSFQTEGPLNMHINQNNNISTYDLINSLSEIEISSILKEFGEERWHRRITQLIVNVRQQQPIETTQQLSKIVLRTIPSKRK